LLQQQQELQRPQGKGAICKTAHQGTRQAHTTLKNPELSLHRTQSDASDTTHTTAAAAERTAPLTQFPLTDK
jgi:hypothetical protein